MLRRSLIPLVSLLAAAAVAAPAGATTFCVHTTGSCPAGTQDRNGDLQGALSAAGAADDADVVQIGPGEYTGQFSYVGDGPLAIVGAGPDQTRLIGRGGNQTTVLKARGADVSHLGVRLGPGAGSVGISATNAAELEDIDVDSLPSPSARTAVVLSKDAKLRRSTIAAQPGRDTGVELRPFGQTPVVEASTIRGLFGVRTQPDPGSDSLVLRSSIEATFPLLADGSNIAASNVVLRSTTASSDAAAAVCHQGASASIFGDHLTLLGQGATAVSSRCDAAVATSSVTLENSVIDGFDDALSRSASNGGVADLSVTFSDVRGGVASNFGAGTMNVTDNLDVPPGFAADGEHLAAGSPLIDAGAPGASVEALDRDGNPRIVGARRDMGAYEFVPAPAPPAEQPPTGADQPGPAGPIEPAGLPAPTDGAVVTDTALRAELRRTLGRRPRRGVTAYTHRWLTPGTLTIRWVVRGRTIARGRATRSAAGRGIVRVRPTRAGRRLLRSRSRVRVSVRGAFTPSGRKTVRVRRTIARL